MDVVRSCVAFGAIEPRSGDPFAYGIALADSIGAIDRCVDEEASLEFLVGGDFHVPISILQEDLFGEESGFRFRTPADYRATRRVSGLVADRGSFQLQPIQFAEATNAEGLRYGELLSELDPTAEIGNRRWLVHRVGASGVVLAAVVGRGAPVAVLVVDGNGGLLHGFVGLIGDNSDGVDIVRVIAVARPVGSTSWFMLVEEVLLETSRFSLLDLSSGIQYGRTSY